MNSKRWMFAMALLAAALWMADDALAQRGRGGGGGARPGMAGPPAGAGGARGGMDARGDRGGMHGRDVAGTRTGKTDRDARMRSENRIDHKKPADHVLNNEQLASRLQSRLPEGTNLQNAAGGFKNAGQFVAAVNVSNRLGIPFDQLKSRMTGDDAVSLGKAIEELKPEVDGKAEAKRAEKAAKKELEDLN